MKWVLFIFTMQFVFLSKTPSLHSSFLSPLFHFCLLPISKAMKMFLFKEAKIMFHVCLFLLLVSTEETESSNLSPMEKSEQEALYSAIQGFAGKWWNGSQLYPDPCGGTPIQGVSCDLYNGLWYVTVLDIGFIHDNSLGCKPDAEFRQDLFELKHLKTLSIVNCFIYPHHHLVSIPIKNWENLSQSLESLEFRSNPSLIGQIPSTLSCLTRLQSLVAQENGLSGELPYSLGNLVTLKRVVLAGNRFSGQIPSSLGGLTNLLIFDSSRNFLSGSLPLTFGGLISLLKLDLSNNHLSGALPIELGNLKNLTILDFRHNKFSGGLVQTFEEMVSLQEMALSNNPISGELKGIKWENLQNLVTLDLSYMELTGEIPESMAELRRLRYLGLNNNSLSGNVSPKLASLPCISALYLYGNNLTGKLEFSEWFYGKMGRRFAAWSNQNLCYPMELVPTGHYVPFDVQPCDHHQEEEEVSLLETNSSKTTTSTTMLLGGGDQKSSSAMGFSIWNLGGPLWTSLVLLLFSNFIL